MRKTIWLLLAAGLLVAPLLYRDSALAINVAGCPTSASPCFVTLVPPTSGGLSVYHVIAAASDNHANIKNAAGQVYFVDAVAAGTGIQYVRLYNAASGFNGCNSATNLIWGQQVPATATASGVGAGYTVGSDQGVAFSTGISICITGAVADTDTTNAATTTVVNVWYK